MELRLLFDGAGTLSGALCLQAIQDLAALRPHLHIKMIEMWIDQDVEVVQFLRDQIAYIKVCQSTPIRVLMTAYPAPYPWSVILPSS